MKINFRAGKKRSFLISLLAGFLIFSTVIATFRVAVANTLLSESSVQKFSGVYGKITDRFGTTVYDGTTQNPFVYANIVDCGGMMNNVLSVKYKSELSPGKVNFLTGYRTMEKEPRIMKTTLLSEKSLNQILEMFGENSGCVFAYNYKTGEVYVAASMPSADTSEKDFSYINRCFNSIYTPGSTMKIVTSIIAIEQGIDLDSMHYICTGSHILPDGEKLTCPNPHGYQSFSDAIGNSCNCFFATLVMELNIEKAIASLERLGFNVNKSENKEEVGSKNIDRLTKTLCSTNITDAASFSHIWGLIGQGDTVINPVDMAKIAGAVMCDGETASPYIVESIINPNKNDKEIYKAEIKTETLISSETAKTLKKYWLPAFKKYYVETGKLSSKITFAKTGTAETGVENLNRSLFGVIEDSDTAFYIMIEDWENKEKTPMDIATALVSVLPKNN